MALTKSICGTFQTANNTDDIVSYTTPSFTPNNSSLLVAVITAQANGGSYANYGESVDGGGWTWTRRVENEGYASDGWGIKQYIYTAPVTTGASMTFTYNTGKSVMAAAIVIYEFLNYDTSTPTGATQANSGKNRSGAWTGTLSGTPSSDSYILAVAGSDDGTITCNTSWGTSDWDSYIITAGHGTPYNVQHGFESKTGTTSTTVSFTALTTSYDWAASSIEIKAGSAPAASRRVFIMC